MSTPSNEISNVSTSTTLRTAKQRLLAERAANKDAKKRKDCPLKTDDDQNCPECVFTKDGPDQWLHCHCGNSVKMIHGRIHYAKAHWESITCKTATAKLRRAVDRPKSLNGSNNHPQVFDVRCAGLTDKTWLRPGQQPMLTCIQHSCTAYHGYPPRFTKSSCRFPRGSSGVMEVRVQFIPPNVLSEFQPSILGLLRGPFHELLLRYTELQQLIQSVERSTRAGDLEFWTTFGVHARAGLFKDVPMLRAVAEGVAIRAEREAKGLTTRGMPFNEYLDNMLTTAGAYSKGASELFRANLAGRSSRGFRLQRQRIGARMHDKFHIDNVLPVVAWLERYGYSGPVSAGTDQTVCVKALRYNNSCLVGVEGGDVEVSDLEHLEKLVEHAVQGDHLCKKLPLSQIRAYTLQVPLPNVPTFVVALISSREDESAEDIKAQHLQFINLLESVGIRLISLGSDGAASEVLAQELLVNSATEHLEFSAPKLSVNIRVPLLGASKRPVVVVQDPKHARKTASNQLLSGARFLAFGRFNVNLDQLLTLLQTEECPLGYKDVLNTDKQDDGRAYRTFSEDTFKAACAQPDCLGLVLYLYIFGELVDSWLNQSMPHRERIISSYTAVFFVRKWKAYLLKRQKEPGSLMNLSSNQSHRDHYPTHPLMPWKHGTECCEHIFGWMRVISPTFTVLDARQMMPKIFAVIKSIMSGHITLPMSENLHAGYKHDFSPNNTHDFSYILSQYPSNSEINELLELAESRAEELAAFAGMTTNNSAAPLNNFTSEEACGEHELDVSVSIHKRSYLNYPFEPETITVEQALETAAGLTSQHQETDVLMSQITVNLEALALELLEPYVTPLTTSEALVKSDGTLHIDQMLSKRHAHDSQVKNYHGPEKPRITPKDLPVPQYDPDTGHEVLLPSQYSKAVSFFWRSHEDPEYGEARKHRWRTLGKRKSRELTNKQPEINVAESGVGSQVRDVDEVDHRPDQIFGMGAITATNPLTKNKWVVVIKQDQYFYLGQVLAVFEHHSGKHAWIAEAHSREKVSYVSLKIYQYKPGQAIIQAAHNEELPNEFTFSHLPAKYIAYVFTPQHDESVFLLLESGHYQVPSLLDYLIASRPAWQRLFSPQGVKKSSHRRTRKAVENDS
ncbi:uncharacterized protein MELLADRAFT_91589 [Melampsora larici-populina 98AG31]|uniref:Uncharacterized protein n=1 Tax=Melampsora larici-populina (strain 98AG31 / pathotype 3-4-7) TaxID=747676 RepID=F4RZL0_MELLP|nr:uncharacterized protein MELLADRAFT_91589 [Melampsora larici-populina 98AG31]EGG02170.1 hypothetical protein MELLADRAFT_91589 [Melampsora larici-populina 98AG31]